MRAWAAACSGQGGAKPTRAAANRGRGAARGGPWRATAGGGRCGAAGATRWQLDVLTPPELLVPGTAAAEVGMGVAARRVARQASQLASGRVARNGSGAAAWQPGASQAMLMDVQADYRPAAAVGSLAGARPAAMAGGDGGRHSPELAPTRRVLRCTAPRPIAHGDCNECAGSRGFVLRLQGPHSATARRSRLPARKVALQRNSAARLAGAV